MKRYQEDKARGYSGKNRKKKKYDCGKSSCYICHSDKLFDMKTIQEHIADIKLKEQKDEL